MEAKQVTNLIFLFFQGGHKKVIYSHLEPYRNDYVNFSKKVILINVSSHYIIKYIIYSKGTIIYIRIQRNKEIRRWENYLDLYINSAPV